MSMKSSASRLLRMCASEITPLQIPPTPSWAPVGPTHPWTTLKWVWCCCQTLQCAEHPSVDLPAAAATVAAATTSSKSRAHKYGVNKRSLLSPWQGKCQTKVTFIDTGVIRHIRVRNYIFQCGWKTWNGRFTRFWCFSSAPLFRQVSSNLLHFILRYELINSVKKI